MEMMAAVRNRHHLHGGALRIPLNHSSRSTRMVPLSPRDGSHGFCSIAATHSTPFRPSDPAQPVQSERSDAGAPLSLDLTRLGQA